MKGWVNGLAGVLAFVAALLWFYSARVTSGPMANKAPAVTTW